KCSPRGARRGRRAPRRPQLFRPTVPFAAARGRLASVSLRGGFSSRILERNPMRPDPARAASEADDGKPTFRMPPIPARYNMGVDVCTKWAEGPERLALLYDAGGEPLRFTFQDIEKLSNQTANLLRREGATRGARIALMTP